MSEFVLFNNIIILWFYLVKQRNCCSPLWYGSKKQNSSYKFAQRQSVVRDDCGVSFVIITGALLVSLDCLNTLIMMKSGKDYRIGTLHNNWPMSAHTSQAFSTSSVPIV